MKLTTPTIGVLATIIVLASIGGIYTISYNSGFGDFGANNIPQGATMFLGNVKVIHLDENDQVIGYRHGSNHITATGMQIIMG